LLAITDGVPEDRKHLALGPNTNPKHHGRNRDSTSAEHSCDTNDTLYASRRRKRRPESNARRFEAGKYPGNR